LTSFASSFLVSAFLVSAFLVSAFVVSALRTSLAWSLLVVENEVTGRRARRRRQAVARQCWEQ
jgi:hypothetical protein